MDTYLFIIGYLYALKTVKTIVMNVVREYKLTNNKYERIEDIEIEWKITAGPIDYGIVVERRRNEFY